MIPPSLAAAVAAFLGWVFLVAFFGVIAVLCACMIRQGDPFDITHDSDRPGDDVDEPLTAPGPAHPASRAFAARRVGETVPFNPPPIPATPVLLDDSWADRIEEFADVADPQLLEQLGQNPRGVAW